MENYVPRGLFSRIIKRLGLEKELLIVKKHLSFFTGLFIIFSVLSIFAFIGLKQVLAESNFGPYLSLVFSDPEVVVIYWQSFFLSVLESMPGSMISISILVLAIILLSVRLIGMALYRFLSLRKSIRKQYYGNK